MIWLVLMLPLPQPTTYECDVCELNTIISRDLELCGSYWLYWDWGWHHEHGYGWYCRD